MDIPSFGSKPPQNAEILADFGKNTSSIPSGQSLLSYRVGFNWDVTGDQRNQLRGGAGIFTGRPAFVWMSNMFGNTGGLSGFAQLTCLNANAPKFNATTAATPPTTCTNGTTASAGSEVDLMQSNVKFPQTQRESIGFDRDLGNGWVGTVEGLLTQNLNDFFYQNIALAGPQGTDPNGRVMYGSLVNTPILKVLARNRVLEAVNTNKNWGYSWTVGAQRVRLREFEAVVQRAEREASIGSNDVEETRQATASAIRPRMGRQPEGPDRRHVALPAGSPHHHERHVPLPAHAHRYLGDLFRPVGQPLRLRVRRRQR